MIVNHEVLVGLTRSEWELVKLSIQAAVDEMNFDPETRAHCLRIIDSIREQTALEVLAGRRTPSAMPPGDGDQR